MAYERKPAACNREHTITFFTFCLVTAAATSWPSSPPIALINTWAGCPETMWSSRGSLCRVP